MSGFIYKINRTNIAASLTVSAVTIVPAAARHTRIRRIALVGMGTASLAQELLLSRVNVAGVGALGTTITPRPINDQSPAYAGTVGFTYATTEPTLGVDLLRLPFNNNGGVYIWRAASEADIIEVRPGTTGVTLRGSLSTGSFTFEFDIEEL